MSINWNSIFLSISTGVEQIVKIVWLVLSFLPIGYLRFIVDCWNSHPFWTIVLSPLILMGAVAILYLEGGLLYLMGLAFAKLWEWLFIGLMAISTACNWLVYAFKKIVHWIYMGTVGWIGLLYARLVYGEKQIEYYSGSWDVRRVYYLKDGQKNGPERFYYHFGGINKISFWKKGKKKLIEKIYFPNGKLFLVLNGTDKEGLAHIENTWPLIVRHKELVLNEGDIKELRPAEKTCNEEFSRYRRVSRPLRKESDSKWLKMADAVRGRYTQQAHDIQDAWEDLSSSLQDITEKRLDILREAMKKLQEQTSLALENTLASYLCCVKDVGAMPKAKGYRGAREVEFEHIAQQHFDELAQELSEFEITDRGGLGKMAWFAVGGIVGGVLKVTWDVIWDTDQLTKVTAQAAKLAKQAAKVQASWVILDGLIKRANELTHLTYEINSRCDYQLQYLLALAPDFDRKHPFYSQIWENTYGLMTGLTDLLGTVAQWGKSGELSSAGLKTLEHTQKLLTTSELINYGR